MRLLLLLFASPLVQLLGSVAAQSPEPVVHPDRTVSFRLLAPSATQAAVALDGIVPQMPLHREADGRWTGTTPVPLAPAIYSYHFEVDSHPVLDMANPQIRAGELNASNTFLVPGTPPAPWETAAVPHGAVHHHTYTTGIVHGLPNNQSDFFVYTPPGYDARDAKTKYPVLYLLHGWGDTAAGWTATGHADDILDNGIAAGTLRPMIVVMPLGYGEMSFVHDGFGVWKDKPVVDRNVRLFAQALLREVLPEVEHRYNVSARREDRAIAGLSMGGLEALTIGLEHPDQFAYVGGFSSAVHQLQLSDLTGFDPVAASKMKLFWIACGTADDLLVPNRRLVLSLKGTGAPVTAIETPGAHTWMVWRENLVNFLPLLFR